MRCSMALSKQWSLWCKQNGDQLLPQCSFQMGGKTASYVTDRTFSQAFPSSSSVYYPNKVRARRFQLGAANNFIDPASLRLKMEVVNEDATHPLVPRNTDPAVLFRRATRYVNGALVEIIDDYARLPHMLASFLPLDKRNEIAGYGFEVRANADDKTDEKTLCLISPNGILQSRSKAVMHLPMIGPRSSGKMLPLFASGLVQDCELATATASFSTEAHLSQADHLEDCRLLADTFSIDTSLLDTYMPHRSSGKPLMIPFRSHNVIATAVTSTDFEMQLNRNFTRASAVYLTLLRDVSATAKEANHLYGPCEGEHTINTASDDLRFFIQAGDKRIGEYDFESHAELYYRLRQCLGTVKSTAHRMSSTKEEFRRLGLFEKAFDLEKMAHADFSGLSLGGALVTIRGRNVRKARIGATSTANKRHTSQSNMTTSWRYHNSEPTCATVISVHNK